MIRKSKSLVIIALSCIISIGFLFQSCEKQDLFKMDEQFITTGEKTTTRIDINDPEILSLKNKLENSSKSDASSQIAKEVNKNNLSWDLAYKVTQGSMKGVFVPLKSSTEDDFKILASLYINGSMKEFILQKKSTSIESSFTGEINTYRLNGKRFRQIVYENGVSVTKPTFNKVRLKSSPCETDDGTGTYDDYEEWFDADCDSQRFANNTDESIWYKPENDSVAKELKPGEWTDEEIDGFSAGGNVYKVCDGYNTCGVSSDENGISYETDYSNPINWGYNEYAGGEKDDDWLSEQQAGGDHGWDDLFGKR